MDLIRRIDIRLGEMLSRRRRGLGRGIGGIVRSIRSFVRNGGSSMLLMGVLSTNLGQEELYVLN